MHAARSNRAGKRRANGGVGKFFLGQLLGGFAGNEERFEPIDFLSTSWSATV